MNLNKHKNKIDKMKQERKIQDSMVIQESIDILKDGGDALLAIEQLKKIDCDGLKQSDEVSNFY